MCTYNSTNYQIELKKGFKPFSESFYYFFLEVRVAHNYRHDEIGAITWSSLAALYIGENK